uniref:Uncharacterized protein n=1 Tax=Megaselia scalaris TaxID=36166 RepID=T1GNM2_MEGSC
MDQLCYDKFVVQLYICLPRQLGRSQQPIKAENTPISLKTKVKLYHQLITWFRKLESDIHRWEVVIGVRKKSLGLPTPLTHNITIYTSVEDVI